MESIKLILPRQIDRDRIMDYKNEFISSGDSIDGSGGLKEAISFEGWYNDFKNNLSEDTVSPNLVSCTTFIAVREEDNKIVGMISIRHRLNEYLLRLGGHIGYSVRASERRKGYASRMLKQALVQCKELDIYRVLITCNKNNIGSAKTILNNGGILENEIMGKDRITQRYWIELE